LRIALACRMPAVPIPISPTFSCRVIVTESLRWEADRHAARPGRGRQPSRGNGRRLSGRHQDPAAAALRRGSARSPDSTEYETDSQMVAASARGDHPPGPLAWFGASGPAAVRPATNPAYTGGAAPSTAFEPARLQ